MSSPIILYLSPNQIISKILCWVSEIRKIKYQKNIVNSIKDMEEIKERNKEGKLPILKHGDLLIKNESSILQYLLNYGIDNSNWIDIKHFNNEPVLSARINDSISYFNSVLNPIIKEFIIDKNNSHLTGLRNEKLGEKLKGILEELNTTKRNTKFFINNNISIIDLLYMSSIYLIETDPLMESLQESSLFGWYRVCKKIINNTWDTQELCDEDYELDVEEEGFVVAEIIMEAVKENRPDIVEKLAKEGYNINMPLAVIEAVNRNNLFILKVMRDNDCYLKWPMAISQAMRLSKPEDILAILIDPNKSKEELIKEAKQILHDENEKMKEVLGPEYEEYKKKQEANKPQYEQVRNNTIMEGVHVTSKFVFFNSSKAPYSIDFLRAFKVEDIVYKSILEYLLCEKANFYKKDELYNSIKNSNDTNEQIELGNTLESSKEWLEKEDQLLFNANKEKFTQHKDLQHVLLQVSDKELVKTGKGETYWGIGLDTMDLNSQKKDAWIGNNKLGVNLMKVREDLLSS